MWLSKQRNSYQSSPTLLCLGSPTALFVSQHNFFRTMWPDRAKGPLGFLTKLCLFECLSIIICLRWSWKAPMRSGQLRIHLRIHKLYWDASYTVGLYKQRKVGVNWYEFLFCRCHCVTRNPTKLIRTMLPDRAKGLFDKFSDGNINLWVDKYNMVQLPCQS